MKEIYKEEIINDYHHLQKCHNHELEDIMEYAITKYDSPKCDIEHCTYSARHFRVNSTNIDTDSSDDHLMDSLHFYLCHLYHI